MNDAIAYLGLVEDHNIQLDLAALDLAALDHPNLDTDQFKDQLDELEEALAAADAGAITGEEQADALSGLIATEGKFSGDRATYDDPANADFIELFVRRRGLPVTLSILYVAMARRIGWDAEVLNTPGHVLARIGKHPHPVLIDPFHDGMRLNSETLASLLASVLGPEVVPDTRHLLPMTNREVLVRLLMNQASRASLAGDSARALTLYERMTVMAPAQSIIWWERARLERQLGRVSDARASLNAMMEMTRDPALRSHIAEALSGLGRA